MNIRDLPQNSYKVVSEPKLNINSLPKDSYAVVSEQPPTYQEDPGFFKGIARGVVKPFARLGTNLVNAGQIALGEEQTQPFSGNFLGEVKPVGVEGTFGEKLKDTLGVGLEVASNIPIAKGAGLTYQGIKTAYKSKALLPTLVKSAVPLMKEGAFAGGSYGVGQALEEQKGIVDTAISGGIGALTGAISAPIVGLGLPIATRGIMNIPKMKSALTPESTSIMNRVARLDPTDARKFEKLAGKSHGQYLTETGNFGRPDEIIENEAKKFVNSIKEVDTELDKLPGIHKSRELDTVLDDLVKREAEIGVPNKESREILSLYNKNKTQGGLSMKESNAAKRLYERNVKLGYQKENNTIGIARATRLDDALRKWQFKTASNLGLKNLDKLNQQTQLSKFIVDKLGKKVTGGTGNDALSLTDMILLSGGDPTAVAAFFLKRGLLNRGFQAEVARALAPEAPKGPIKAEFGGKTGLPAKIGGRDYGTTIEMRPPRTPTSFESPAQKINRSSSLPEQRLLSAPTSNAQGSSILLPRSIRETNLGLDEVRNVSRAQTNQTAKPQQILLPKELNKPYNQPTSNILRTNNIKTTKTNAPIPAKPIPIKTNGLSDKNKPKTNNKQASPSTISSINTSKLPDNLNANLTQGSVKSKSTNPLLPQGEGKVKGAKSTGKNSLFVGAGITTGAVGSSKLFENDKKSPLLKQKEMFVKSPSMSREALIPLIEKLPNLPKKELPKVFRALQDMGVEIIGTAKNSNTLYNTSEVFNKIYKEGKNFNLKLKLVDKEFEVENPLLKSKKYTSTDKAAGAWRENLRQIDLIENPNSEAYKFMLAHEIGHSLGLGASIEDEHTADAFADQLYPGYGYSYKNNPFLKSSWQPGYVPPDTLQKPKFPNY